MMVKAEDLAGKFFKFGGSVERRSGNDSRAGNRDGKIDRSLFGAIDGGIENIYAGKAERDRLKERRRRQQLNLKHFGGFCCRRLETFWDHRLRQYSQNRR